MDKKFQEFIKKGEAFERNNELEKSLECYSEALDHLVALARGFAQKTCPADLKEILGTGKISHDYLEKFNKFLKKDKNACVVSNNMAVLFAKMGENASAKIFFEQSIDLTPEGQIYDDPHIGLQVLTSRR